MSWYRLLRAAPELARIVKAFGDAREGNPEAVQYLRSGEVVYDAAEAWRDGGRAAARNAVGAVKEVIWPNGRDVVDAEFRVLDGPPWEHALRWLKRQRWGTFVVLGPKGSGKSTFGLRLAEMFRRETGWPVQGVKLHPEDRYPFVTPVPSRRFLARIRAIQTILDPPEKARKEGEEDQAAEPPTPEEVDAELAPFRHQVIVIDEASLLVGVSGMDAGRALVRQVMAQARHCSWLVVYVAQLTKMLPLDMLLSETLFVKQPRGDEVDLDRPHEAVVASLWAEAIEAFKGMRKSPWYVEEFADPRAWAYAVIQDAGGGHAWKGLMPARRPMAEAAAEQVEGVATS